jgi:hypothetical protein
MVESKGPDLAGQSPSRRAITVKKCRNRSLRAANVNLNKQRGRERPERWQQEFKETVERVRCVERSSTHGQ